jgi:hypothetical protein
MDTYVRPAVKTYDEVFFMIQQAPFHGVLYICFLFVDLAIRSPLKKTVTDVKHSTNFIQLINIVYRELQTSQLDLGMHDCYELSSCMIE